MHNLLCHCFQSPYEIGCQWSVASCQKELQLASDSYLLVGGFLVLGGAFQDAKDFFLAHDQEVFAVNLDLGAGVLAKQDAVAFLHIEREGFAFAVGLAPAHRDHFALLRLVLGAVGNDDSATGGFGFFNAPNHDAVVQGSQLCSHSQTPFSCGFGLHYICRLWPAAAGCDQRFHELWGKPQTLEAAQPISTEQLLALTPNECQSYGV